jgi:hypothetical protein
LLHSGSRALLTPVNPAGSGGTLVYGCYRVTDAAVDAFARSGVVVDEVTAEVLRLAVSSVRAGGTWWLRTSTTLTRAALPAMRSGCR